MIPLLSKFSHALEVVVAYWVMSFVQLVRDVFGCSLLDNRGNESDGYLSLTTQCGLFCAQCLWLGSGMLNPRNVPRPFSSRMLARRVELGPMG